MNQVNAALAAGTWTGLSSLYAWGNNANGQLGLGNTTNYSSPKQIGSLTNWLNIAGGYENFAAIKTDGTLWSWGKNNMGQLGLGNTTTYSSPKQVGALTAWSKVTVGSMSTFAIKTNGTLWAWGYNPQGQLGLNNLTYSFSSPVQVGLLTNWAQIISNNSTHAVKTDGTLWAWGLDALNGGVSGLGNTTTYSSPKQVGALTNWSQVSGSQYVTFAVKTDGTLWAWGFNTYATLGLGNTTNYSSPKQIGALTTWGQVIGIRLSALAITTSSALWAWGRNESGCLGLGNTTIYSSPKQVGALTNWSKGAFGSAAGNQNVALLIKTDGTLWTWGDNIYGQLGLGNATSRSSPNQVGTLTTWSSIATSFTSSLAIATT